MKYLLLFFLMLNAVCVYAQNPILRNIYTADPAAREFSDGRLYLFADSDPAGENGGWLNMFKYHAYSTTDMKVWTDHGPLFDCKTISWNDGPAWDGDCVEVNGKYYYYFSMVDKIGVAVADKPTGPFKDGLGKPLLTRHTPGVRPKASGWLTSPTILFYRDSVYMYFGQNEEFYLVRLKKNMLELDGPVMSLEKPAYFHEGAWVNYAHGKFHATYGGSDGNGLDKLCYAVADQPQGPFQFKYFIQEDRAATVQSSVVSFKGMNYLFYHIDGPDEFHRRISVEPFQYTRDGLIPPVPRTASGAGPSEQRIDATGRHEAEDYQAASGWGIDQQREPTGEGDRYVNVYSSNTWIRFDKVDFGNGVSSLEAFLSAAKPLKGGKIELRLGSPDGALIGECTVPQSKHWFNWVTSQCKVSAEAKGVHDLYLVMKGDSKSGFYYQVNYMLDSFRFLR